MRRARGAQLEVGLAVHPAALEGRELARRREVGGVALGRAALGPRHDGVDLCWRRFWSPFIGRDSGCANQGGISRSETCFAIAFAHGRTSS